MPNSRASARNPSRRWSSLAISLLVLAGAVALGSGAAQAGPGPVTIDPVGSVDAGADHDQDHLDCLPTSPGGHDCHGDPGDDFRPNGRSPRASAKVEAGQPPRRIDPYPERYQRRRPGRLSHAGASDTDGHTTVGQVISGGDPASDFQFLGLGPGEPRIVREDLANARSGRIGRRVSLAYLGHLTDFQVSDEESPARVEFIDITANKPFPDQLSAAHRPQEALVAHGADQAIRQMNNFTADSPHPSLGAAPTGLSTDDSKADTLEEVTMNAALMTGDLADNQQKNETEWVVRLLEGGTLDPNSGIDDFSSCPGGIGPADPQLADPRNYAGVQDKDDYPLGFAGNLNQYYDPDSPGGVYSGWPVYGGLLDRAQDPFEAAGLQLPGGEPVNSYVVFGNHDGLAQGNQRAIAPFEAVGLGCVKPLVSVANLPTLGASGTPPDLATLGPGEVMVVPPDRNRRYVDKAQFKGINDSGFQADAHGFAFVDPAEEAASNGAAGYYAFDLKPGIRMIGLDTLCEAGVTGPSAAGNIDDPQWQWLIGELEAAQKAGDLIIPFGHHPIRSLDCNVADETPPPCASDDSHGHDINPGCDRDPRDSSPVHDGDELSELLRSYPNVIAYIAGHTHSQTLTAFPEDAATSSTARKPTSHGGHGSAGDFWGIETASLVDWPPQSRLVEVMDNCDGTLSILATVLDTAAPSQAPGATQAADGFGAGELASIARTLAYNDPQGGPGAGGQGEASDRNVELLLEDPRPASSAACETTAVDDGDDDDGNGGGGNDGGGDDDETSSPAAGGLPFTGLGLAGLALLGGTLLAGGLIGARMLRRS